MSQTCEDYLELKRVIDGGYASPEMQVKVANHEAICVDHGGLMPGLADLQQIFRDMFTHVGHQEICKDTTCKCDDDYPSLFESEVVRQFRKKTGPSEERASHAGP